MAFSIADFIRDKRDVIIAEWIKGVKTRIGEMYAGRSVEEILGTVTEAYDADLHVLLYDDYSYINRFIERITKMRLEAGFSLSDVQMAFELFRSVTIPLLARETTVAEFAETITRINRCLTYTIHRFSDFFQSMHQAKILEHNQRLEEEVRARTAALKESELKYKTLVEEINDGYFVVQKGIVVFANPAFAQMHGYTPSEVIGKKFFTFIDPSVRDKLVGDYHKIIEKWGSPRVLEYLRLTRDGKSYPTEILAKLTEYDNKPSSIGICRDITARVMMEQKVRETERMAYIGQITTSLSHEIRNPLSAVQMNLQLLRKNPQLEGNDLRRLDISIREVRRLESILKELLDFAKPIQVHFEHAAVNRILLSAIELLEMKFKEEKIEITTDLDFRIPAIMLDREKLEQAIINLLLNALEASDPGGRICIRSQFTDENGGRVILTVSDEGCSIPEQHLDDIFRPFFTTKSRGTGLGLSNVKRIAEAHKGKVEVENRIPRGASFKISLPIQ
jgi:PAS domain S-box-containing protein